MDGWMDQDAEAGKAVELVAVAGLTGAWLVAQLKDSFSETNKLLRERKKKLLFRQKKYVNTVLETTRSEDFCPFAGNSANRNPRVRTN